MMDNYKQFAQLTKPEQLALFEAWLDGKQMQWRNFGGSWVDVEVPVWCGNATYRVKPLGCGDA